MARGHHALTRACAAQSIAEVRAECIKSAHCDDYQSREPPITTCVSTTHPIISPTRCWSTTPDAAFMPPRRVHSGVQLTSSSLAPSSLPPSLLYTFTAGGPTPSHSVDGSSEQKVISINRHGGRSKHSRRAYFCSLELEIEQLIELS